MSLNLSLYRPLISGLPKAQSSEYAVFVERERERE